MAAIRLAIAAYRCVIAGKPGDSLDIQVCYFTDPTTDIETFLREAPPHSYVNSAGQTVEWPFAGVLGIEEIVEPANGTEVVGFVAAGHQFLKWARSGL
jgi:hypothetical protein